MPTSICRSRCSRSCRRWSATGTPSTDSSRTGSSRRSSINAFDTSLSVGRLCTDEVRLAQAADDFGHCVSARPAAVVVPGSTAEVQGVISYARTRGLRVAARGAGHSTYGQSQCADGIVLDMTGLRAVHEVAADRVVVDAGALWSDVVDASLTRRLTPPVLTDYLGTTVGGTLSVGGFGGASHRHGAQTDNVLALEVVTGTGTRLTCSATENRELFDSVRGGLGRFGVITRATLSLTPARERTRWYRIWYDDLAFFLADEQRFVDEGMYDHVQGRIIPAADGTWRYRIELARHYTRRQPPDAAGLFPACGRARDVEQAEDLVHADFINRMAAGESRLRAAGDWFRPHPWLNVLLPAHATAAFVRSALAGLTVDTLGRSGLVMAYPVPTARLRTPFVRTPAATTAFMFALLRTTAPGTERSAVSANRSLYERALAVDAVAYPVNALPMSAADWRRHFGPRWHDFVQAKHRFDPHGVLTPLEHETR
ncbi:FAD-binding protein [Streptomyces sp. CA-249302]|uniref:FAD-binding protein n=1 Tax=Streptomyces sp. CA-249302 TaxID=3240058 RepID=UPI003D933704